MEAVVTTYVSNRFDKHCYLMWRFLDLQSNCIACMRMPIIEYPFISSPINYRDVPFFALLLMDKAQVTVRI